MNKIFKLSHERFSIEIHLPKNKVLESIALKKKKENDQFHFLTSSPVDFNEITVINSNLIEIHVMPKMFNPYRGTGKIHMALHQNGCNLKTKVKGEIVPYSSTYIFGFYMIIGFLLLWTVVARAISTSVHTIIMLLIGWMVFPFILYLIPFWNRSRLRRYRDSFLTMLN
ncbi:hypothetical protein FVR03_00295 [Pontibacter qinzhouensis]|uniref:Uncharacterized protein n=1 Tax=Pontibacter qinzhouensis TaxID=2603253 RepID=A0A5C8KE90_9BACT|nr:hypothetical protein [Pontibacter qinzhouensis]TXK52848.1 hypothetical protein FVR03_00295 [Pontibacter qinzhouensis]